MGIESAFDLLGLYSGVDLARKSVMDVSAMPDMVFLYRRPILDYWAEHEETLGAILTHVLVHEIGHHFGLSDADMERIEAEAVCEPWCLSCPRRRASSKPCAMLGVYWIARPSLALARGSLPLTL